jgi:hypothetical protein
MDPYSDPIGTAATGQRPVATHHASAWGLGSLLMALTLLVLFPMVLPGVLIFPHMARIGELGGELSLITTLADVVAYGFVGLAGLATVFGVVGLISGFVRHQPVGLPVAALVVSLVALVLWIVMFLGIQAFKREIQYQYQRDRSYPVDRRDFDRRGF